MHDFPWWKYLNYHLHYQNKHKHKIVLDTPLLSPLRLCDKWWMDMIKNGYHLLNTKPFWHQITIRHLAKVKLGMGFSSEGGVSSSTQASQTDLNQSKLIQLVWPFHLEVFGWISKEKKKFISIRCLVWKQWIDVNWIIGTDHVCILLERVLFWETKGKGYHRPNHEL